MAASDELCMGDAVAMKRFSTQRHRLDVAARSLAVCGRDGDVALRVILRVEVDRHFIEDRRGDRIEG